VSGYVSEDVRRAVQTKDHEHAMLHIADSSLDDKRVEARALADAFRRHAEVVSFEGLKSQMQWTVVVMPIFRILCGKKGLSLGKYDPVEVQMLQRHWDREKREIATTGKDKLGSLSAIQQRIRAVVEAMERNVEQRRQKEMKRKTEIKVDREHVEQVIKRIKTEGKEQQQQQHAPDAATSQPGFGYGSPVVQAFPVASAGGFSQQPPQFLPTSSNDSSPATTRGSGTPATTARTTTARGSQTPGFAEQFVSPGLGGAKPF